LIFAYGFGLSLLMLPGGRQVFAGLDGSAGFGYSTTGSTGFSGSSVFF